MMLMSLVASILIQWPTLPIPEPLLLGFGQFYSNRRRVGGYRCVDTGLIHNGLIVWRVIDDDYPSNQVPIILENQLCTT